MQVICRLLTLCKCIWLMYTCVVKVMVSYGCNEVLRMVISNKVRSFDVTDTPEKRP